MLPNGTELLKRLNQSDYSETVIEQFYGDFRECATYLNVYGVSADEISRRLSQEKLSVIREKGKWYPLDNGAKQYPITMTKQNMPVFRISAKLRETVVPAVLQVALTFTLKHFPHFTTRLCKGFFWYYLQPRPIWYTIEKDINNVCLPMDLHDGQMFRVLYKGNSVSVEILHVLTDGTGGLIFLKSLLAEYYRILGTVIPGSSQIFDPMNDSQPSDTEDCFEKFCVKIKPNPTFRQ